MYLPVSSSDLHWALTRYLEWQGVLAHWAKHQIELYRYPALFLLLFASGAGLPLPEDIPLLFAGALIARHSMTWTGAGLTAWFGMLCGDTMLYVIGYKLGWKIVHLPLLGRHLTQSRLKRCEDWFKRWGLCAIGIGRLFAGIRTAMVAMAGTMRYPYGKLLLADGVAAFVSGAGFVILGYWATSHAEKLDDLAARYREGLSLFAVIALLALLIFLRWRNRHRIQAKVPVPMDEIAH